MIDVHCHLNFKAFEKDYDKVIKRVFDIGVAKIINVGAKEDSLKKQSFTPYNIKLFPQAVIASYFLLKYRS